jgi:hypothetical protein
MLNLERGDIVEWPDGRRLGDGATFRADGPPRVVFAFDG